MRIRYRVLHKIYKFKRKIILSLIIFIMGIKIMNVFNHKLQYPSEVQNEDSLDVVYTWVNGTDKRFQESILKYKNKYDISRFDDKNELKYSLRSLEKYAPWVRHVYIVTNGQIPHWLDMSYSKVSIITHTELTQKPEYLPTFSSSSIETFIHRIPKLSKRFLYINDDIFLNAPLFPEDLFTKSEGVKIFNAWTVPDCAPDCPWVYIGDGTCDQHCNIQACQYDGGDCNISGEDTDNYKKLPDVPEKTLYQTAKLNNTIKEELYPKLKNVKVPSNDSIDEKISFKTYIQKSNFTDRKQLQAYVTKYNSKKKNKSRSRTTLTNENSNIPHESTTDIFMHSLVYTNKLLNLMYGFKTRYVLGHVGFLLDVKIIEKMQEKFHLEIDKTAKQRFRSVEDVQFAFLYYNFLMSEMANKTINEIFDEFDTDNSGSLSDRELRTLLTRVYPLPLDWAAVKYVENIFNNCSRSIPLNKINSQIEFSTIAYERYEDSKMPVISKFLVEHCLLFKDILMYHFGKTNRYKFTVNPKREMHSNFMMLKSNISDVINSLDKFRRNPKKFNCINDNLDPTMNEENEMVRNLLEDFYISFFPHKSKFELHEHYRNKFLYMDDFLEWRRKKFYLLTVCYLISAILFGIILSYVCVHKSRCTRRCIELL